VAADGSVTFTPEPAPSASLSAALNPEDAFAGARRRAADRLLDLSAPDGPPFPLAYPGLQSLWVQSYSQRSWALVQPVGAGHAAPPRIVEAPFLDALLTARQQPLAGAPANAAASADPWLAGFLTYGFPLTDSFRRGTATVQRFTQGWLENE